LQADQVGGDAQHVAHGQERFVGQLDERMALIIDPMLATGGSMVATVDMLKRKGCTHVRALVLVDSTHPRQMQGEGSPDHWPWWVRALFRGLMSATAKEELAAVNRTGDDVLALPPLTGKTVIVLSATKPLADTSALGLDANAKRRDIARLYPGSRQIWVDSGHGIPLEKPTAVISKIREVLP